MAKYQTGELTEEQVKLIHEALKAKMEENAEAGLLQETDDYAVLQEVFGEPYDKLIRLDD